MRGFLQAVPVVITVGRCAAYLASSEWRLEGRAHNLFSRQASLRSVQNYGSDLDGCGRMDQDAPPYMTLLPLLTGGPTKRLVLSEKRRPTAHSFWNRSGGPPKLKEKP